jgi:hypothetical protein
VPCGGAALNSAARRPLLRWRGVRATELRYAVPAYDALEPRHAQQLREPDEARGLERAQRARPARPVTSLVGG